MWLGWRWEVSVRALRACDIIFECHKVCVLLQGPSYSGSREEWTSHYSGASHSRNV